MNDSLELEVSNPDDSSILSRDWVTMHFHVKEREVWGGRGGGREGFFIYFIFASTLDGMFISSSISRLWGVFQFMILWEVSFLLLCLSPSQIKDIFSATFQVDR